MTCTDIFALNWKMYYYKSTKNLYKYILCIRAEMKDMRSIHLIKMERKEDRMVVILVVDS